MFKPSTTKTTNADGLSFNEMKTHLVSWRSASYLSRPARLDSAQPGFHVSLRHGGASFGRGSWTPTPNGRRASGSSVVTTTVPRPDNWLQNPSACVKPAQVAEAKRLARRAGWQPGVPAPECRLRFD